MRELKFRAWGVNSEGPDGIPRMYPVYGFDIVSGKPLCIRIETGDNSFSWMEDETKLMQCTGLKDKNDKEIYEGDIIQYSIEYIQQSGFLVVDHVNLYLGLYHADPYFRVDVDTLEVVGNVYENRELLTNTEDKK